MLEEELAPLDDMANDRLRPRHVHIRLQVPTARNTPAPLAHKLLDVSEQERVILLHPAIQDRLIVVENEGRKLFQKTDGGAECRDRFGRSLVPPPLPDRVEMSIADQMNDRFFHTRRLIKRGKAEETMELLRENQASQRALTGLNCNLTAVTRGDYYLSVNCPVVRYRW